MLMLLGIGSAGAFSELPNDLKPDLRFSLCCPTLQFCKPFKRFFVIEQYVVYLRGPSSLHQMPETGGYIVCP